MSTNQLRIIGVSIGALIVFATGFWLTKAGRPYGALLMNVHKIIDVLAIVVIGVMVVQANRATAFSAGEWALIIAAAILVVVSLGSGGALSAMQSPPSWVLWLHRIAPWVMGAASAGVVYLAVSR